MCVDLCQSNDKVRELYSSMCAGVALALTAQPDSYHHVAYVDKKSATL